MAAWWVIQTALTSLSASKGTDSTRHSGDDFGFWFFITILTFDAIGFLFLIGFLIYCLVKL
jgi:hypothetical protein